MQASMKDKPNSLHHTENAGYGARTTRGRPARSCAQPGNKELHTRGAHRTKLLTTANALAKRPRQDRYGDTVIDDPVRFDAIEVHNMCEFVDSEGAVQYEADCDHNQTNCFGVYAHLMGGGIDCCGDFSLREDALDYGRELVEKHDWPLHDHTSSLGQDVAEKRHQRALLDMAVTLRAGYYNALQNLDPQVASDLALASLVRSIYIGVLAEIWLLLERSQN
jgi:hypothetical protein